MKYGEKLVVRDYLSDYIFFQNIPNTTGESLMSCQQMCYRSARTISTFCENIVLNIHIILS